MADDAAWGDDVLDLDREDGGQIDWTARGSFVCEVCGKVLSTAGGLKCHATHVHGEAYGNSIKGKIKAAEKAKAEAEKSAKLAEARRLNERRNRKVNLTTEQVDEIVSELNSLIDMMEPYYSQCDGAKDARALIDRLEAMADGKAGA